MQKRYVAIAGASALCLALGSATAWWLSREPADPAGESGQASAASGTGDPRVREVMALARDRSADGYEKMIEAYGDWAGDPSAVQARRLLLGALFAEPNLGLKLKRVLEAIEADPTPPPNDPLWPHVTERVAELWTPETFERGRDLMLMENRPRARQALIDSWGRLVDSDRLAELNEQQRRSLVRDLIDLYPGADSEQKPRIEGTLRKLAGNDLPEVLSGRGLEPGATLEAEQSYEREVQEALARLPAETQPEP